MRIACRIALTAATCLLAAGSNAIAAQSGPAPAPVPRALIPNAWQPADWKALLREIDRSAAEGLDPARYGADRLRSAIDRHAPDTDAIAERAALLLAHDYAEGSTPVAARTAWHLVGDPPVYRAWLGGALARHDLGDALRALLPATRGYAGLRDALRSCDSPAHCTTIRVNLDRWRWLPNPLGYHYLWVNPAAFRLDLIEDDQPVSSHRIIVGKTTTQTTSFAALVTGVTANPWWNVPSSIVAESVGATVRNRPAVARQRGYVASRGSDGRLHVRQRPGPNNALGVVKLEMPNPYSIFIHDTPSRHLFDQPVRAYSHGCIRTERPDDLARIILTGPRAAAFDRQLASGENGTIALDQPIPVYVVYFTAEADKSAPGGVRFFDDVYRRDGAIAQALSR